MGSSTAYHLARANAGRIVVLEKSVPAGGPSGKSHAVMPQYYTLGPLAKMTAESWRFYLDWEKIVGKEPVFHKVGILWAFQERLLEKWKRNLEFQRQFNLNPKLIYSKEIQSISPKFWIPEFYAASYDEYGGYVDSQLAVSGFLSACKDMGVSIQQQTEVTGFDIRNGKVVSVSTNRGNISTGTAVCSAGIWTRGLLSGTIGMELPITNTKVGICMMRRPQNFRGDHEVIVDYVNSCYLRAQGNSGTDVAIFEPHVDKYFDPSESENPDSYSDSVPEKIEDYVRIASHYPGLQNATVQGTFACVYDNSPDRQPLLGSIPNVEGLFVAVGFSGHGFKMAPMIGRSMSEMARSGNCSIDLHDFRLSRFLDNQPIKYDPLFDDA
jgi:sarcosine oxidase, subunit beta